MEQVKESPFKFKNINITKFYFEYREDFEDIEYEIEIERNVTISVISQDFENNNFEKKVTLDLLISDLIKSPVMIQATISGDFRAENMEENIADRLFKENAPSLLLSYIRPIISVATSKSEISYDIPFLNFSSDEIDKISAEN